MTVYEKFLRLLDFSDEEMGGMLPLWKNACTLLSLSEEDVRFAAEDWIPKYWDMSLHGIRKCIGAYIREFIEMTRLADYKAQGAKILYCNMPSHPACIYANKLAGGERIHVSPPDFMIATVLTAFFNKSTVLPGDDSSCMNPLCHHCGMNRLRADAHYKGIIVPPSVMWNWGLFCNEGPKTEEFIGRMGEGNWNYVLTTLPHDVSAGVREVADEERVSYLAKQLREGQRLVSGYTSIPVTDAHVIAATQEYLSYIAKVERLTDLVSNANPQPITGNELTLFGAPTSMAFDTWYRYLDAAIDVILEEVEERVAHGAGPLPADSPRLACHFVPFCVPWVDKAFQHNGVNLSINTFLTPVCTQLKYFDPSDIYKSIAQQWLSNPNAVNMLDEASIISEMLKSCPLDGVLYGFFSFDRWIGSLQKTMIKIVEEKTGIPHFYLEGDFWNDEHSCLNDRMDQIQSIAYRLKINHMVSGWNHVKK